jgi:carboxymethylenebutenolidase
MNAANIGIGGLQGRSFGGYLALPPGGSGPGLLLCQEIFGVNRNLRELADAYAEEGYVVLAPDFFWRQAENVQLEPDEAGMSQAFALLGKFSDEEAVADLRSSLAWLRARPEVTGGTGVVGYCLGGKLAYLAARETDAEVCIGYYGVGIEQHIEQHLGSLPSHKRLVLHFAGNDAHCGPDARARIIGALQGQPGVSLHVYPGVDHAFARRGSPHFDRAAAAQAHERTIRALRRAIGPDYDLEALWEEHLRLEFDARDADATMTTMVAEPYVNHVPTLTGGVGFKALRRFYRHHFIHANPPDTRQTFVSRTVGSTQIVDELLFSFTHTQEIDWMLPGIAPTGKFVEVALVAVVQFRGPKLCHEHIHWDQASVLKQLGLIDGKGLPVAGIEAARKVVDETLPSNGLMARWATSAGLDD